MAQIDADHVKMRPTSKESSFQFSRAAWHIEYMFVPVAIDHLLYDTECGLDVPLPSPVVERGEPVIFGLNRIEP
jgi:hypothetical protein